MQYRVDINPLKYPGRGATPTVQGQLHGYLECHRSVITHQLEGLGEAVWNTSESFYFRPPSMCVCPSILVQQTHIIQRSPCAVHGNASPRDNVTKMWEHAV
jgi:hypothetical protein